MKKISFLLIMFLQLVSVEANIDTCHMRNKVFSGNEKVTFYVFYTLAGLWVHAGNVTFTVNQETLNNRPVYHITGEGATLPGYDWIYRVRDKYETYTDTATMLPLLRIENPFGVFHEATGFVAVRSSCAVPPLAPVAPRHRCNARATAP